MTNERFTRDDVEIQSQQLLSDEYLKLSRYVLRYRQFNGEWGASIDRELLHRAAAVSVVLYDPKLDKVILVEQFRMGAISDERSPWLLELVAGIVEEGEQCADVAVRETKEESGITISAPKEIYRYYTTPGVCSEQVILYYAECDSEQALKFAGVASENEDIKVHAISRDEIMRRLHAGELRNVNTIVGLQWLQAYLAQN